jgi:hypothetical protein
VLAAAAVPAAHAAPPRRPRGDDGRARTGRDRLSSRDRDAAEGSADWLLYELPELRGRIAFDGRFEIYSPSQFASIRNYLRQSGPGWERVARDYHIVVVDPERNGNLFRTYRARHLRVLYLGARVAVFDRARRDR